MYRPQATGIRSDPMELGSSHVKSLKEVVRLQSVYPSCPCCKSPLGNLPRSQLSSRLKVACHDTKHVELSLQDAFSYEDESSLLDEFATSSNWHDLKHHLQAASKCSDEGLSAPNDLKSL